ncbi:MAG: hypothetical protein KAS32_30290 [Candidatus Peribacteraceae bacterium]|nr:hypothetical protein [Candidatus Peribacteraceae bacterium]
MQITGKHTRDQSQEMLATIRDALGYTQKEFGLMFLIGVARVGYINRGWDACKPHEFTLISMLCSITINPSTDRERLRAILEEYGLHIIMLGVIGEFPDTEHLRPLKNLIAPYTTVREYLTQ